MTKRTSIVFTIFVILFMGGIVFGHLGRTYCTRSNENYEALQPESFVPDVIETVLHSEKLKQIYVCYNDANCVNVYSESGQFLWAVATPYLRNSYFTLQNDNLIIYQGDAYIYSAVDGTFRGLEDEESLNLDHDQEIEQTGDFQSGEFYFDSYQVYTADTEGNLQVIVSRPWWHWFFHYGLSLSLAFIGAAGIGITLFLSKKKVYTTIRKSITFKSTKAKSIQNYFIVTTVIHVAYTLLNVICAFFTTWLIIGIIPLTLHMIFSSIVLWNMIDRLRCSYDETEAVEFWGMCEIGSYIIAFLSVIIASAIAG